MMIAHSTDSLKTELLSALSLDNFPSMQGQRRAVGKVWWLVLDSSAVHSQGFPAVNH